VEDSRKISNPNGLSLIALGRLRCYVSSLFIEQELKLFLKYDLLLFIQKEFVWIVRDAFYSDFQRAF